MNMIILNYLTYLEQIINQGSDLTNPHLEFTNSFGWRMDEHSLRSGTMWRKDHD